MTSAQSMQSRGFSLIEIAVVLLIISVLVSIVAIPLATQIDQQRVTDTNKQLEVIKEAVIGFALANGRLPCPATDGAKFGASNSNGMESPPGGGICKVKVGYLPAATLGISPVDSSGFAIDAWGTTQNRILYGVADISITGIPASSCPQSVNHPLTSSPATGNDMKAATMDCLSTTKLISVCSAAPSGTACGGTTLTSSAPFVLISLGKNAPTGGQPGTDEIYNLDGDLFFVSHTPTPAGSIPSGEFDDIVVWPSLNTLFARMVQAGKLP